MINFDKIKSRLESLKNKGQFKNILWRPEKGKQSVRLVPYKKTPDYPFVELYFHYGLAGKTWLSPITFGRPDPVEQYAKKLKNSGDEQMFQKGRELTPKKRTYSPLIVRGQESEGVKWWGYGKEVFEELLSILDEGEFGDITDPVNGYDLTVDHKTAEEIGAQYPKTYIRPKAKPSALLSDEQVTPDLLKLIMDGQPDLMEVWKEPTFDELNDALYRHLNPDESAEEEQVVDESVEPPDSAVITPNKSVETGESNVDEDTKPSPKVDGPPVAQTAVGSKKAQDFNQVFAAFDDILKKK